MDKATLGLGVLTAALLSVILAFGNTAVRGDAFAISIELLPFVMLPSSALFAFRFWRSGRRWFAAGFALNVVLFAAVVAYLFLSGPLPQQALFVSDVLQLDLYLLALGRHWTMFAGGASR